MPLLRDCILKMSRIDLVVRIQPEVTAELIGECRKGEALSLFFD